MRALLFTLFLSAIYAETYIPATDPAVWTVGRTRLNADSTLSFDWESTQFYINVKDATYVRMHIKPNGNILGLFLIQVDGWEQSQVWVGGNNNAGVYLIADDLRKGLVQIRVISVLEPAFESADPDSFFTFVGFSTDGSAAPAGPARSRKIELVGDSISAGFGSRGSASTHGCPVTGWTSGNPYTYNWFLAEYFQADLVPIAWSGKGMYQNCCDNGETMPAYYLQTLGGGHYTEDWNFSRYVPDMLLINLGTNDFNHDTGPAWREAFTQTYVDFMVNATVRYNKPKLPIFVGQGPMNCGDSLKHSLHAAITKFKARGGNVHFLDMCGPPNDGCGSHPGVVGHVEMFEKAKHVIASIMNWQ